MNPQWLSNSYLVADTDSGEAALIDTGGPLTGLQQIINQRGYKLTQILLTHHHVDHIFELDDAIEDNPGVEVLIHPLERELVPQATGDLNPGDKLRIGTLSVELLHTPGHTAGMVAPLLDGSDLFTGDTLFKGSVGGVHAPGHTTYADLRHSVMDVILSLPGEVRIHPGHTDATTVATELEQNPFVRIWRGLDQGGTGSCVAFDQPATLIALAQDYDGGKKAWVRYADGADDIVPGSRVQLVS